MFCDERQYETGGDSKILSECVRQLEEYFNGQRFGFDLPIRQEGTDFQQSVWAALTDIPFGSTVSYSDLARSSGCPKSVRAVGAANGQNKVWIIVPCHRVIGADGSLTGYAGGIERKRLLLAHEAQVARNTGQAKNAARPVQLELF
jgi:methylated-DNA-[protein]-cysteine S-methyltransferase